jgi:hypothetical protein
MSIVVHRLRASVVAVAAILGVAAAAPAAKADILGLPGTGCPDQQLAQPFAPFGDDASYVPVPGGNFEPDAQPWSMAGGAQLVGDNEPWGSGQQALSLPAGASATSPATCVSLVSPTLRFFARSTGSSLLSSLQVNVLFRTPLGTIASLPVGTVLPSDSWKPTLPYVFVVNALAPLGSSYHVVAFQVIAQGSATWEIDDVYVDPWTKG